ncbi:SDR family oxidoreductase [Spirosoma luteolum]
MTEQKSVAIIGLGWLGMPLAKALQEEGYAVIGSTTSADKRAMLQQQGLQTVELTLNPAPVGRLEALLGSDVLVINVPPRAGRQGTDFHPQQVAGLIEAIRTSAVAHIIYVSSTSVYPEQQIPGRALVEADVTSPAEAAAPALVRAEQTVLALSPERTVTILRCGGLMGYDRIPGKYVAGRTVDSGSVPVNYIHRDDVVGILQQLIRTRIAGTYNAVAPEHPPREAIYRRSCADFGYTLPTFIEPDGPVAYKVISSDKLITTTGYTFTWPNPLLFSYDPAAG